MTPIVEQGGTIAAAHDVHDNGVLDTGFLGMPKEPFGASGKKVGRMSAPKFEHAVFTLRERRLEVAVERLHP